MRNQYFKTCYIHTNLEWFGKLALEGDYILQKIIDRLPYENVDKGIIHSFLNSNEFISFCTPKLKPKGISYSNVGKLGDCSEAYICVLYKYKGEEAVLEYLIHNIKKYLNVIN
jgi:hypothetical protein